MDIIRGKQIKGKELEILAEAFNLDVQKDLSKKGMPVIEVYFRLKKYKTENGFKEKGIFTGMLGKKVSEFLYFPKKGNKVEKESLIPYSELNKNFQNKN